MNRIAGIAALCVVAVAMLVGVGAVAQTWPSKPITLIVPFAPGGATDITARTYAKHLEGTLGQPVVIENKPGAGGNLGAQFVKAAPADGYTIMLGASFLTVNPALYANAGFETLKDFTPLGAGVEAPVVLVTKRDLPVTSTRELIALAKSRAGALNAASPGAGTLSHIALVLLNQREGTDIAHIPYRGSAPAKTDVMGGRVDMMFDTVASMLPQIKEGQVKALAVTTAQRVANLPDTPTMAQAGVKDFVVVPWNVFFVRQGTPQPIVDRLSRELATFAGMPSTKAFFAERGLDVIVATPAAFAERVARESREFGEMIRLSGAKAD
jgi:tripartite-type tricarboxylate transporter receptor subunit TctC